VNNDYTNYLRHPLSIDNPYPHPMVGFMHHYFSSRKKQNNIDAMDVNQKA
jgi:hypothetical protein